MAAVPVETPALSPTPTARVAGFVEDWALLTPVVALLAIFMLVALPRELYSDSWLAVLGGREVFEHGLPTRDPFTIWAHATSWVDQQWLGQLAIYGLFSLGGIRLALFAHGACVAGSFAAAVAVGRRRSESTRAVLWLSLPLSFEYAWTSLVLRSQSLAYPLFVAVFWLLATDVRRPSRRVWLVAPLLVIWANVHGTVIVGAVLVAAAAISTSIRLRRVALRNGALLMAALVAPFASPYAFDLGAYYLRLSLNPQFSTFVTEWQPSSLAVGTFPLYVVAIGGAVFVGRRVRALNGFELTSLVLLLALALHALRGIPWFCLAALMTLPAPIAASLGADLSVGTPRLRRLLAAAAAGLVAVVFLMAAIKPTSELEVAYPPAAANAVAAAAGANGNVYASEVFADWLVVREPSLRGRVAYDARFELLSPKQLLDVLRVRLTESGWRSLLAPYDVAVIEPREVRLTRALIAGRWSVVYRDPHVLALRRSRGSAR